MFDLFGNPAQTEKCRVTVENGALKAQTPYHAGFVAAVKGLPASARKYDPQTRAWLVSPQYGAQLQRFILECFNECVEIPACQTVPITDLRVLDVWYLGRCKLQGDIWTANGMNRQKDWLYIFPETALREWFEGSGAQNSGSLYGLLGVARAAEADEIKSAYRRMARQWHPDVCREPNAQDIFMQIQEAYEILSDPQKRARYDAGLILEASLGSVQPFGGYRAPLRCGYALAEGYEQLGRFYVQKILKWEDIVTEKGTLVASWPAGATEPVWQWI